MESGSSLRLRVSARVDLGRYRGHSPRPGCEICGSTKGLHPPDSERATGHEAQDTGDYPQTTPIDADYGPKGA